jgi:hypothetical protein
MGHADGLHRRSFGLAAGRDGLGLSGLERRTSAGGMEMRAMAVEFPVVQIQTALLQVGVLTVDEVRSMRGLGPIAPAVTR